MKFLALLSSAAVASATLVTYPGGLVAPAKTPEVLAAEAAHFAAKGALGVYGYGYYPYAAPLVTYPNGAVVPADTPAQFVAKSEHFAAHGLAAPFLPYAYAPGYPLPAGLVAHPNGALVPLESAEIIEARKEHLAAHAKA